MIISNAKLSRIYVDVCFPCLRYILLSMWRLLILDLFVCLILNVFYFCFFHFIFFLDKKTNGWAGWLVCSFNSSFIFRDRMMYLWCLQFKWQLLILYKTATFTYLNKKIYVIIIHLNNSVNNSLCALCTVHIVVVVSLSYLPHTFNFACRMFCSQFSERNYNQNIFN